MPHAETPGIDSNIPSAAPSEAAAGLAAALAAVRAARRIGLIAHVTPDADCIGCIASLWLALPELGKYPLAFLPEGTVSRRMNYLVRHAGMQVAAPHELTTCDLVIVLDTAKEKRANVDGKWEALAPLQVLNIDHHPTNTRFGRWQWIVPHASSTCELVYELLTALGCQITPTIATLLYAGLHGDTHGFSLSNATPRSFAIAHDLALKGARIAELCERLHRANSRNEFELLKLIYANTRVSEDGKLAWSTATYDEIAATGSSAGDIEDQVDIPRSVEGIAVALLMTEGTRGKVRVNFRGEGAVPVLELAQQFGGGGHVSRAGAMLSGTLAEVEARVLPAAQEFVRRF